MILDGWLTNYQVSYPFHIVRFRSLDEHHWDSDYLFLGESHNFWEFACVLEGEVEAVHNGKIYLLKPGSFICCPPMVFHSSRSAGMPSCVLNFTFEHTGVLPAKFTEGVFTLTAVEINELKSIFCRLQDAFQKEPQDLDMGAEASFAMTSFLIRLARNHDSHDRLIKSRTGIKYQKLIETMQATLYDNLTVQQIASRNGVSVTTMKELFQKHAGISPKRYYANMRGIEALRLLESGMEIAQISEVLNYSSPNYFSSSFKKQFGIPPGQYRKQHWESKK